jgi:hypothetical protein
MADKSKILINAPFFPKNKRAGDAQPQLSFKKEEKKRLLDGMASYDLTLKGTFCPRRC